jgi:hypothetical protein
VGFVRQISFQRQPVSTFAPSKAAGVEANFVIVLASCLTGQAFAHSGHRYEEQQQEL